MIEILIALAIIGAIASMAVPALSNFLVKSERQRAQFDLYQLQTYTEQHFTETASYPTTASLVCSTCQVSEEYDFTITTGGTGNNIYILKATPKATSSQKNDDECYTMIINAVTEQSNVDKDGDPLNSSKCWI
ncbi:type IV pilin protein [Enterovibrio sp. ZSDZ35]|uniref:Type IV pilin protein n=2 Tax=Enterovibrio qingdaonensis TaxID=2899818 RepID=A0ABT5QTM2_9GAMM|nr:type IV pilin protein [Enterovibrio sp. ZSDZ35]